MVEVKVQQGWLSGEKLHTVSGDGQYYSFKGIPYAEPPLGTLRFKAPRPPVPWEGIRKATAHGPKCPQVDIFTHELLKGDEDCLYLNVYTPDLKPSSPLPVMFFIHGGGYKSGSGDDDNYGPDFLVTHGVVLVTINYRLEALGFLCLDTEEVPGNAGMKDQVAALRWVNDNITNFGGDPNNITVFGESAGGASTFYHVLSPMSKGLFKRAIPMSGAPFCDWSVPFKPQKRAFILGKQLGFDTNDPNELLEFLQQVPVEKLINVRPCVLSFEYWNDNITKMYFFTPVIEKDFGKEQFLTEEPREILKQKKINDVDVLCGYTDQEMLVALPVLESMFLQNYNKYPDLVVPRKILNKCTPDQILEISERMHKFYFKGKAINTDSVKEFIYFANQSCFVYDVNDFMCNLPKFEGKRYMYEFACYSDRNVIGGPGKKYGIEGAAHLDDLMYLLHAKRWNLSVERKTREYELIQHVCTIFTNFAKYGNPTPDSSLGLTWPEFNNTTRPVVTINDTLSLSTEPYKEDIAFWKSIYEYAGFE